MIVSDLLTEYIRSTSLWPQRRNAICIYLFSLIIQKPNPSESLKRFLAYELSPLDCERIDKTMSKLHSGLGSSRLFTYSDIQRDWDNSKGAVMRTLLCYMDDRDPLTPGKEYFELLTKTNQRRAIQMLWTNNNVQVVRELQELSAFVRTILENTKELSYLFKYGFFDRKTQARELAQRKSLYDKIYRQYYKNDNYHHVPPTEVWKMLGQILYQAASKRFPDRSIDWLFWGFPSESRCK